MKENLALLFTDEQHAHVLCLSIFKLFIKISDKTKQNSLLALRLKAGTARISQKNIHTINF